MVNNAPEQGTEQPAKPQPQLDFSHAFDEVYNRPPTDVQRDVSSTATASDSTSKWSKGEDNTDFKALGPAFEQFDSTEAALRQAQTAGQAFTDTPGQNGEVKRTYKDAALQGWEHTFNKDGSVDLKVPGSANLGFERVKFQGEKTQVADASGNFRDATPDEIQKLTAAFPKSGGEFTTPGQTTASKWSLDMRGNSNVENVAGLPPGSTLSVRPPNSVDDVRYRAEVKGTDQSPGFSTEATGTKENGWRFVDYDDSKKTANDPKTRDGRSIEGFVARRQAGTDQPPLALTSENQAGDGSVTTIDRSRVAHTKYPDTDPRGRRESLEYPEGHATGLKSQTSYNPESPNNPDGKVVEYVGVNGRQSERVTKAGTYETTIQIGNEQVVKGFANQADARNPEKAPVWSRQTFSDGSVATNFPPGHPSGLVRSEYAAGPPPMAKLYEKAAKEGDPPVALKDDDPRVKQFIDAPPAVQSEQLSPTKTREVRADGSTVTKDATSGVVETETANGRKVEFTGERPTPAELAKLTGLKENDPRLVGVTSVTFGKGSDAGSVTLNHNPGEQTDGRTFTRIERNAQGVEVAESRDGIFKQAGQPDRAFVERHDKVANTTTREYGFDPAKQRMGDIEVRGADGNLTYQRLVEGNKVTTNDVARGRTEVRDYGTQPPTWKVTEKGQTTEGTMVAGEKGQILLLDKSGTVAGMEFTEGRRKGESYTYTRDADGNIKGMDISVPARDGQAAQHVTLDKTDKGWVTNPPGSKVPGFDKATDAQGNVRGDFSTNAKGDLVFESYDKQTKEIIRGNGGRDTYDMRDYSRVREDAAGNKVTQYWDGYGSKNNPEDGWRTGTSKVLPDGRTEVTFNPPMEGRPSRMVRDGREVPGAKPGDPPTYKNGFEVEFPDGTKYNVNDWREGKMQRTRGQTSETLYNTGAYGSDGRLAWAKGTEANGRVTFDDPRVASGEIPREAVIDPNKGEISSTFADGTKLTSDMNGKTKRIQPGHKGAAAIEPIYGRNGELKGYKQGDRTIMKGPDNPDGQSKWTIDMADGKPPREMNGRLSERPGGQFEIAGANGDRYESNGRFITKEGGKDTVYDARGQKWQMQTKGDAAAQPPTKPTWTVGEPPKTFTGDMKLFENGNVGIQNGENTMVYNPDKSVSTIDKQGIERQRDFADNTYIKRDAVGALTEFKSANGDITTLSYEPAGEGKQSLTQVVTKNAAGQVVRLEKPVTVQGEDKPRLRVSELDGTGKEKVPPVYGNEVSYDRMGTRSEIARTADGGTRRSTDLGGKVRESKIDAQGRIVETPDTTGNGKLTMKYDDTVAGDRTPATIHKGNDANPYAVRVGGPGSDQYNVGGKMYTLDQNGQLVPESGRDPANSLQLERRVAQGGDQQPPAGTDTAAVDAQLAQRYGLDVGSLAALRGLGKTYGLESKMTAENLDNLLKAATDNGLKQYLTPEHLQKIAADLEQLKQTAPPAAEGFAKILLSPEMFTSFSQEQVKQEQLDGIAKQLPASLTPFLNEKFIKQLWAKFMPAR